MESHSLVAADFLLIQKSLALKVRKQSLQLIFNEMGVSVKVKSVYTSCVARQLIEFSLNRPGFTQNLPGARHQRRFHQLLLQMRMESRFEHLITHLR